ncbi:MAG: translational GTPase TypA [Spirochaetales bacterium]|nr:translational GTPase TypA [Spirochaetales bacterium]
MHDKNIRNIAIIAHVDHGKTTLVDQMFRQSGMFRDNQAVAERMMDSMDLERERGITISSKNGSFTYKDVRINIVDTPGHADFGGQVERVLRMVDGVLLLVDAAEGPMPQTYYVLRKALALHLSVIVVINKIDKPASRPAWVCDQVLELLLKLDPSGNSLDFPFIYASARDGYAGEGPEEKNGTIVPLFEAILRYIPEPPGDPDAPLQMLVSSLSYSSFLGRLAIGRISSGSLSVNREVASCRGESVSLNARITKIYSFEGAKMKEIERAAAGDIVALSGLEAVTIGETITDPDKPLPLPFVELDPPTMSVNFIPNDSPFAGRSGKYVTGRHVRERLYRETLNDVALRVEPMIEGIGYKVSGRGELHISILIEKMRREGYEFQVTRPEVIYKKEKGELLEPYEELYIDVDEQYHGGIIGRLGVRKGRLFDMQHTDGMVRLIYKIPTRGLLGFRTEFLTESRGTGTMNYMFCGYDRYAGEIRNRKNGVLICMEECTSSSYALFNLQERRRLFLGPQVNLYEGQIIGEHSRENDLVVNPGRGKKLTNIRAAGSDENIVLTPPVAMSLEDSIAYINDDELVEVTPEAIRLRKIILRESERKAARNGTRRAAEDAEEAGRRERETIKKAV